MLSQLELKQAVRKGQKFPDGSRKTERNFLDFVVNGVSLHQAINLAKGHDDISVLCLDLPAPSIQAAQRLLLLREPDFPNDRRALFVCPECGDLSCGAATVRVVQAGDTVTWRDFGYENNYEDRVLTEDYQDFVELNFDRTEYERTLQRAIAMLSRLRQTAT